MGGLPALRGCRAARNRVPASYRPRPASGLVARRLEGAQPDMAAGCATVRRARTRSGVPRPSVDAPSAQAGHQNQGATSYRSGRGDTLPLACIGGARCTYSAAVCVWQCKGHYTAQFVLRACMCSRPASTRALFRCCLTLGGLYAPWHGVCGRFSCSPPTVFLLYMYIYIYIYIYILHYCPQNTA